MDQNDPRESKRFLAEMEEHLGQNDAEAVLDLARERLEQRPGDLEARIALCLAWLLRGNLDEAREMLDDAEQIIESLSRVYAAIGEVCRKRGMQEAALAYHEKFQALHAGAPRERSASEWFGESEALREADEEGEPETAAVPPDFQTVTLAELYIRQGHFQQAEEVLEKIVSEDPQNEKAAALLQEAREQGGRAVPAPPGDGVIAELSHWLDNIDRLRGHAT
jgi:Tfp pilus assembly protein PilF